MFHTLGLRDRWLPRERPASLIPAGNNEFAERHGRPREDEPPRRWITRASAYARCVVTAGHPAITTQATKPGRCWRASRGQGPV